MPYEMSASSLKMHASALLELELPLRRFLLRIEMRRHQLHAGRLYGWAMLGFAGLYFLSADVHPVGVARAFYGLLERLSTSEPL
ncbi:hypothetical protein GN244_ATG06038 [Phytophthora infestans]|uniref:Transmembrane protein n=1 Tax=Phytophthora infestans TaxID=4787 RepID=A0A833WXV3_PHYIN|nr:hypothetical protein GN244_ATG06038 [Phytophthora infestans]KAF4135324.1 hypothetical protein GN958_ATG15512 [Phytophthora infestans]